MADLTDQTEWPGQRCGRCLDIQKIIVANATFDKMSKWSDWNMPWPILSWGGDNNGAYKFFSWPLYGQWGYESQYGEDGPSRKYGFSLWPLIWFNFQNDCYPASTKKEKPIENDGKPVLYRQRDMFYFLPIFQYRNDKYLEASGTPGDELYLKIWPLFGHFNSRSGWTHQEMLSVLWWDLDHRVDGWREIYAPLFSLYWYQNNNQTGERKSRKARFLLNLFSFDQVGETEQWQFTPICGLGWNEKIHDGKTKVISRFSLLKGLFEYSSLDQNTKESPDTRMKLLWIPFEW